MSGPGKALYEQGLACEEAGDVRGAFEAFRRSAKADPRVAAPYVGLSRLLIKNHQRAEGIACLERAVACEPANPSLHVLLGRALAQDGRLERGRRSYEQALRIKPDSTDAAIGIAGIFEDLGERGAAAGTYREILKRVPSESEALAGLLGVADGDMLDDAIISATTQLTNAAETDAALIGYALGKALARRGEHDAAFAAWLAANTARRSHAGAFDRDRFDRRVERLMAIFSAEFFAVRKGWGEPSQQPVFVVGLPRSGTTLTEQILASHPDVFGAGELDLLTDMATGTPDLLGRTDPPWPESALELNREHIDVIARRHLKRLMELAPPSALRIIDKQPLNFWHLGLVALTFPNARIIHCTRDIRDNGLSIFAENFTAEQRWSMDLSDNAHYWRGYRKLMDHWKNVTGLRVIDVAYEDMVTDLEAQARRLTGFLDLPWHAAVLDFHNSGRAVQTPSRWQVRRPLYASSVGRWRHYGHHLAPLDSAEAGTG
jgi:tetratricopeptide (TPR) repeat protein